MAKQDGILGGLLNAALALFGTGEDDRGAKGTGGRGAPADTPRLRVASPGNGSASTRGASISGTQTVEVRPPSASALRITYAPNSDGDPDAGEVIWAWVPYDENDGRGKDRPVLVIARHGAERVYVVRLTSKSHSGDRDFLSIGTGAWDSKGRESWVDVEQVYSVHSKGMRREASGLDLERFTRVAAVLSGRYGWSVGN